MKHESLIAMSHEAALYKAGRDTAIASANDATLRAARLHEEKVALVAALSRLLHCEKFDDDDSRLVAARQQAHEALKAAQS